MRQVISLVCFVFSLVGCAGNKGNLRLDDLACPASTSGYIYDENLQPIRIGGGLKKITDVKVSKTLWSMFYGQASLSDNSGLIKEFNAEVQKAGGAAVVNMHFEHTDCLFNSFIVFNLLPFWPGCSKLEILGDVVVKE